MDESRGVGGSGEGLGRRVRLNTVVIPQVRALGFVAILVLSGLHHALISAYVSDQALLVFMAATAVYNLVSWLSLVFFYTRLSKFDLAQLFLYVDVLFFALSVYVTGAERSWFLLVLVLRSADQAANGFLTVLRFAHWSTAVYLGLLLYVQWVEQRQINWTVETVKILGIYFGNLYVTLTALVLDKVRRQMRNARDLIVQLQKKAKDLDRERQKAKDLAQQKDELAEALGARLRTPLEQILASSAKALGHPLELEQKRSLLEMREAAVQALAALAGAVGPQASGPGEQTACAFFPARLAKARLHGTSISLTVADEVPEPVWGDALSCDQILKLMVDQNLGAEGLDLSVEAAERNGVWLRYTLKGTSVAPEEARLQVEKAGGKIRLENESGRGGCLAWTLRFHLQKPEEPSDPGIKQAGPRKILVAEDNPINQRVMSKVLAKKGYQVKIVSNGQEAVDAAAAESFDCILMDIMMPVMDGLAATEMIRRSESASRQRVPIIAVTALTSENESFGRLGLDGWVPKPFDPEELYRTIELVA